MARVNVYGKMVNNRRETSIGGRGPSDWIRATVNTDNAHDSNVAVSVTAAVSGPGLTARERRLKSIGDQRVSRFDIDLPDASQLRGCDVNITIGGLFNVDDLSALERVTLPGGHSLRHALACIEAIELQHQQERNAKQVG
jgi:hypothetical protein